MSYKRSVHCSYCGQHGHNRAGCSDFKAYIEERRAANPNDYAVTRYDAKKARRSASAKNRRCSYCGMSGHNRAGCARLKHAMEQYRTLNADYRKKVLDHMADIGLGVGSLLQVSQWSGSVTYMVLSIDWSTINIHNKRCLFIKGIPVNRLARLSEDYWQRALPLPLPGSTKVEVLVPASSCQVRAAPPATYLSGKLGLKAAFKSPHDDVSTMRDSYGSFRNVFDPSRYTTEL